MAVQMSKKRKFVADGVFYAELNDLLTKEVRQFAVNRVEKFTYYKLISPLSLLQSN